MLLCHFKIAIVIIYFLCCLVEFWLFKIKKNLIENHLHFVRQQINGYGSPYDLLHVRSNYGNLHHNPQY